jgi:hypothetical protein
MSNLMDQDNEGIYLSIIKKMLSSDENKIYNYFANNVGSLSKKEQNLLIELLNIKCIDDCQTKVMNTSNRDILKSILKNKVDDTILFLKLVFVIVLVISSFVNHDTKFITKHTTMFIVESIIFIMLGTLSFFIMAMFRDKSFSFLTYVFVMMFYLMLHVLFQISGMYTGFFSKPQKKTECKDDTFIVKHAKTILMYTLGLFIGLYSIYIMFIMSYVYDIPDYVKNSSYGYLKFIVEMLIFGILNSIIFYPVAIDRQYTKDPMHNIIKGIEENTFGLSGVLVSIGQMCLLHIVLQYTGFYRTINL